MRIRILILSMLLLPVSGFAETEYFHIQSGTGFFVNRQYIITNAHVVNGCSKVTIKGAVPEHEADVRVSDADQDLALLETDQPPSQFAPLRFNIDDLVTGDKVFVIGYPGEAGLKGEYKIAESQVIALAGAIEKGEKNFYINDVLEHGNSGGPVFDTSGNVIGVVVAKTVIYKINKETQEKKDEQPAGVVIGLATLKQFLFDHGVFAQWSGSGLVQFASNYLEDTTKNYIVNIQCKLPGKGESQ